MKMDDGSEKEDDLRPEYDEALLTSGVRGKYASRYAMGTNVVRLAPDVAKLFPTEESVNEALRSIAFDRTKTAEEQPRG